MKTLIPCVWMILVALSGPNEFVTHATNLSLQDASTQPAQRVPSWATVTPDVVYDAASGWARSVVHAESGIHFVLIPAGTFVRGAGADDDLAADNERPVHSVQFTKPFYLATREVSNREYRLFRPSHRSGKAHGLSLDGESQPVVNVTWQDALAFAARFSMRLPTEAEWEYAARAATKTRYPWGSGFADAGLYANVADLSATDAGFQWNSFPSRDGYVVSAPVASFKPNGWGLFDMIGNVWEWCADAYSADIYESVAKGVRDPGPHVANTTYVLRGGCWRFGPSLSRVSTRYTDLHAYHHIGFRVARDP